MSAIILGCGHTAHMHLFDIDIVVTSPQIHLHFWTNEEEYQELGYGKVSSAATAAEPQSSSTT